MEIDLAAFLDQELISEEIQVFPIGNEDGPKREAKPQTWRRNILKRLRAEGKEYINSQGKVKQRVQGPDCQCRFKCYDKIPDREVFLKKFNELGDKQKQDTYLLSCISADAVHRRRPRSNIPQYSRKYSHTYHIIVRGTRVRICQKAFASLHGVSKKRIQLLATKRGENGNQFFIPEENRGKHGNRAKRVSADVHKNLLDHISSFLDQPDRGDGTSNGIAQNSPQLPNARKVYELYLKKYESTIKEDEDSEKKPEVSYNYFLRFLKSKGYTQFAKPPTNICETCKKIERELARATLSSMKLKLTADKTMHLAIVASFFDDIQETVKKAKKKQGIECLDFDFFQSQPIPKIPVQDFTCNRKLSVHIFCIHSSIRNTATFYIYDQMIGKKTANEVLTFLNHYIETELPEGVKTLNLYSNNNISQNKNSTLMQYFSLLTRQHKSITTVNHRFPEPGHTKLPCHRYFEDIEKNLKTIKTAFIPSHYAEVIQKTSKNFTVVDVSQSVIIKDYVNNLEHHFERCPDPKTINECYIFQFSRKVSNIVRMSVPAVPEIYQDYEMVTRKNGKAELSLLNGAYATPLPVSFLKYNDVQSVLVKYCPLEYLPYYSTVPAPATECYESDECD